jgi:GNAT superfamily N-acetyltransferase
MAALTFKPVTKAAWPDFEQLFESPSAPKYCWCMAWRPFAGNRSETPGSARKPFMKALIQDNAPVGLLAYDGDEPVAWVSIAPKDSYLRLGGPDPAPGERVWSLVCMFAKRAYRGQGIAHKLIGAAVKYARTKGANIIEAYPVDPDAPSYRFGGFVSAYEKAGFDPVEKAGSRRHVMRRRLRKPKA